MAHDREVILFDNAGVAGSGGEVPVTIEGMAAHAVNLLAALGVHEVDLLGFSMGSLVAQQVALDQPALVRRVILVGSGPRGGVGMATLTPEFQAFLGKPRADPADLLLDVFFTQSPASQAAGRAFLARLAERKADRDVPINDKVVPAQVAAFAAWGAPQSAGYLKHIAQPVLVVAGSRDIVHSHDQCLQPAAAAAACATGHLPGFEPRFAVPVSRPVRAGSWPLPEVTAVRRMKWRTRPTASATMGVRSDIATQALPFIEKICDFRHDISAKAEAVSGCQT